MCTYCIVHVCCRSECEGHIKEFVGARYKKFDSEQEAKDFVNVIQSNATESATESGSSSTTAVASKAGFYDYSQSQHVLPTPIDMEILDGTDERK